MPISYSNKDEFASHWEYQYRYIQAGYNNSLAVYLYLHTVKQSVKIKKQLSVHYRWSTELLALEYQHFDQRKGEYSS